MLKHFGMKKSVEYKWKMRSKQQIISIITATQNKNEMILTRLEDEENSLIQKLQKSQELQEQLGRRLERAINLPNDEFKKLYQDDEDINFDNLYAQSFGRQNQTQQITDPNFTIKKQKEEVEEQQKIPLSWLPPPEEEEQEISQEQKNETVQNEIQMETNKKEETNNELKETKDQAVGPDLDQEKNNENTENNEVKVNEKKAEKEDEDENLEK